MPKLSDTIAALVHRRRQFEQAAAMTSSSAVRGRAMLVETQAFGPNPGDLKMFSYRPPGLARAAPLVVVVHGCTQTAEIYAQGSGWLSLAKRFGFAVVCPQQKALNNLNRCFNWFQPGDTTRDAGEVASIRAMIAHALASGGLDARRVYVTGLSAGGAMSAAMLATYPEVFAGGAVVAGLAYGAAGNLQEGFAAMVKGVTRDGRDWGDQVRAASSYAGPWPRVSIWRGDADKTVNPLNADEIAKQWIDVQGLVADDPRIETHGDHRRAIWSTTQGDPRVELHTIAGLAHGEPLASTGPEGCGIPGPFMIECGVSSALEIARFWGLIVDAATEPTGAATPPAAPQKSKAGLKGLIARVLNVIGRLK